jgi:hypothetical protein
VIGLFNGVIPLIAMQMNAIKVGTNISLMFATVLDQLNLGLVDEDEEVQEVTDRAYWENRGSRQTVAMADEILEMIHQLDRNFNFKYNKFYVGLAKNDQPNNFISVRPKKSVLRLEARLPRSDELDQQLENAGLERDGIRQALGTISHPFNKRRFSEAQKIAGRACWPSVQSCECLKKTCGRNSGLV